MDTELLRALDRRLRDAGVICTFQEATPEMPLAQVLLELSAEVDVIGSLCLLPGSDIFQIRVVFPVEVPHQRAGQVARTICAVNATLPFGAFELSEDAEDPLTFRALAPMVGLTWDVERLVVALSLALGIVGRFCPLVVGVADGEIDFKEARRRLVAA